MTTPSANRGWFSGSRKPRFALYLGRVNVAALGGVLHVFEEKLELIDQELFRGRSIRQADCWDLCGEETCVSEKCALWTKKGATQWASNAFLE